MAVAIKNTSGAPSTSLLDRPAVMSLLGALFLLGALGLVFEGVPALWDWLGIRTTTILGGGSLAVAMLVATAALLVLGGWLLGSKPTPGVKAGIFVGTIGLLLALLLARWASLWCEYWVDAGTMSRPTGMILAGVAAAVFVGGILYGLYEPWTQKQVLRLEEMGWFTNAGYKPLQGLRVRRLTVLGILLLVGAGIWTLYSHGTLTRGATDWKMNIPFTGTVALTHFGDVEPWLKGLPAERKSRVQVTYPGSPDLHLAAKDVISGDAYRKDVEEVAGRAGFPSGAKAAIDAAAGESIGLVEAVNDVIYKEIQKLLDLKTFGEAETKLLRDVDARTSMTDLSPLILEVKKQAEAKKDQGGVEELRLVFDLPTGLVVVDRTALQEINAKTDPNRYVGIGVVLEAEFFRNEDGSHRYSQGDIVPTDEFKAEVARLKKELPGFNEKSVEQVQLKPASGETHYVSLTLLRSVQYTFPLLLLALALWFAWRVVNMPAFADFLIATEAEMNKVSWTTQKRLVQDTIVVLLTVVLTAVYLFGVDQIWRVGLSWKPIGVLVIPEEQSTQNKDLENKPW